MDQTSRVDPLEPPVTHSPLRKLRVDVRFPDMGSEGKKEGLHSRSYIMRPAALSHPFLPFSARSFQLHFFRLEVGRADIGFQIWQE